MGRALGQGRLMRKAAGIRVGSGARESSWHRPHSLCRVLSSSRRFTGPCSQLTAECSPAADAPAPLLELNRCWLDTLMEVAWKPRGLLPRRVLEGMRRPSSRLERSLSFACTLITMAATQTCRKGRTVSPALLRLARTSTRLTQRRMGSQRAPPPPAQQRTLHPEAPAAGRLTA